MALSNQESERRGEAQGVKHVLANLADYLPDAELRMIDIAKRMSNLVPDTIVDRIQWNLVVNLFFEDPENQAFLNFHLDITQPYLMIVAASYFEDIVGGVLFDPLRKVEITKRFSKSPVATQVIQKRVYSKTYSYLDVPDIVGLFDLDEELAEGIDPTKLRQFIIFLQGTLDRINVQSKESFMGNVGVVLSRLDSYLQFNIPFDEEKIGLLVKLTEIEKEAIKRYCQMIWQRLSS